MQDRWTEPAEPAEAAEQENSLRHSLHLVTVAWVFGAVWLYISTGAALTRYAQLLHLPKFGFGLLAALPFAGALMQLPTSLFIERFGRHKAIFITAGIIHRALWAAIALVPWLLPAAWGWPAFLVLFFVTGAVGHMSTPIWISWMADLVPARLRGRYFSRRIQIGQFVGLFVTLFMGMILDRAGHVGASAMLLTISVLFGISAVCGVVDFSFFTGVQPPAAHTMTPELSLWRMIRQPLADRNFRRFVGFTATLTFATGYVGQFVWLYLFDVAKMTNTHATTLLVVIPLMITLLSYPMWGRLIDRLGRKPVLVVAGILIIHGGAAWIFVTPEHWIPGYIAVVVATIAWPGVDLANFNILLGISEPTRGARRYGSAYVAVNSLVVAVAGILSGLFAGVIAQWLGDWKGSLFGWPLTYHGVLLLISAALRLAALLWLFGLEDKHALRTREALGYMGVEMYSTLQQAVFMPGRLLLRLGRWTYKLNPRSFADRARRLGRHEQDP